MPESTIVPRFRGRIKVALAVMTLACLLMATALVLIAEGAVALDLG